MRKQVNKVNNCKQFLNDINSVNFTENQKRLREYIKILKENYDLGFVNDENNFNRFDLYIKYFIIIHNFLFLEKKYFDIVKLSNKEINNNLNLPKLGSLDEVIIKFNELYDTKSKVRFGVETLDSIEEIRLLLPELKDFFSKIYKSFLKD